MIQPGMALDTGSMGWTGPQWISNGNRRETLVGTLDGADVSDAEMGTIQFTNFNLDAIAEFKVLSNNYSAQCGQGTEQNASGRPKWKFQVRDVNFS